MKKIVSAVAVVASLFAATAVQAQNVSGVYLGIGIGNTSFDDDGLWRGNDTLKEDGSTVKAYGGYQFNRIIAIEATYTQYGDIKNQDYKLEPTSIALAANVGYTFANGLRPYGILGVAALDLNESGNYFVDDSTRALHFGLGLEYTPPAIPNFSIRLAYEADLFSIEERGSWGYSEEYDVRLDSFYVGAAYRF